MSWYRDPTAQVCEPSAAAARARQDRLTKPQGSLGRLEEVAVELAGRQGTDRPSLDAVEVVVFAADHGIAAEGVSAFPSAVTGQMVANYVAGGAAISVLARALGAGLTIVDVGTIGDQELPRVLTRKVGPGTRNFARGSAMDPEQVELALTAGADTIHSLQPRPQLLILGEMGIGNTTSAAALASAMQGQPAQVFVGAGTGVDAATIERKARLIDAALARAGCAGRPIPALEALSLVGGFEIAALAGAMIRAAQLGISVAVDGFIASVAALCAVDLNPGTRAWLTFAHQSREQGHGKVLDALKARPLLDLGLRLGEGSGAALAVPILRLACDLHNRMATFEEAQVADRE